MALEDTKPAKARRMWPCLFLWAWAHFLPFPTRFCWRIVLLSRFLHQPCPQISEHEDFARENQRTCLEFCKMATEPLPPVFFLVFWWAHCQPLRGWTHTHTLIISHASLRARLSWCKVSWSILSSLAQGDCALEVHTSQQLLAMDPFFPEFLVVWRAF